MATPEQRSVIPRNPAFWITLVILAIGGAEIASALFAGEQLPASLIRNPLYLLAVPVLCYVLVFRGTDHFRNFRAMVTAACLGVGMVSLFMLSRRPRLFEAFSREDQLVENASAGVLFVGAALLLVVMVVKIRDRQWLAAVLALLAAVVLFVIGMEEISWMQRVLERESSDFFAERNIQGETNLHNFNTAATERIFYFGGFFLLILLPYFHRQLDAWFKAHRLGAVATLLPAPWLILPSSVMVGYVGMDLVRDPSSHLAALITALIVFRLVLDSFTRRDLVQLALRGVFLGLIVVMAYYFTTYNYASVEIRPWARKEYLEFIIALGLAGFAGNALSQTLVAARIRRRETVEAQPSSTTS